MLDLLFIFLQVYILSFNITSIKQWFH